MDTLSEVENRYLLKIDNSTSVRFNNLIRFHIQLANTTIPRVRFLCPKCDLHAVLAQDTCPREPVQFQETAYGTCVDAKPGATIQRGGGTLNAPCSSSQSEYDPVLLTIAAGLESRAYPEEGGRRWIDLQMPVPKAGAYFQRPVHVHFKQGNRDGHYLFLIAGSSYSTWRGGSWTKKTAAALEQAFPGANLLALAGFLTPETLSAKPYIPEITAELTARDLYRRLSTLIADLQRAGKLPRLLRIGVLGYSGGANLALSLVAEDSAQANAARFRLGAIAFSPIVDLSGTFLILDQSSDAILRDGFPRTRGLTTLSNMIGLFLAGFRPGNIPIFLELMNRDTGKKLRKEFVRRFYREFQLVDLQAVRRAHYAKRLTCGENSFLSFYRACVFPIHQREFHLPPGQTMDEYADFNRLVGPIRQAPVYLILAKDDPVLVRSSVTATYAEGVEHVLDQLRSRPNFRVFNPEKGGHMGYFLDSQFLADTVRTFFSQSDGQ